MRDQDGLERFTFRAREAIKQLLVAFTEENIVSGEGIATAGMLLGALDDEIPDILEEVMKRGDTMAQLVAAEMFYKVVENFPHVADDYPDTLALAQTILVDQLMHPKDEDALQTACILMGQIGAVPDCVVPHLDRIMGEDEERPDSDMTATHAATALCWSPLPEARARAQHRLINLLKKNDVLTTMVAAPTLLLRRVELKEGNFERAAAALLAIVPRLNWMQKAGLVRMLQNVGPEAIRFLPMLREVFSDKEIPSYHRARAAAAMGSVAQGSDEDVRVLSGALFSTDWHLVSGAADGLALHGSISEADVLQLASHLGAKDKELRRAAIVALGRLGPKARPALPQLIDRLPQEPDAKLSLALAETLAAVGMDAVDPLVDEIKRQDVRTTSIAARALVMLGEVSTDTVIRALLGSEEEEPRIIGIVILQSLGSAAAPAVPTLADMLSESRDAELTHNLLGALASIGKASLPAAPVVVWALLQWEHPEITDIAITALQRMGPGALQELQRAEPSANGATKRRLQEAIAACKRRLDDRYLELEQLSNDNLLRYFTLVGQVLESGKSSWVEIGKLIESHVAKFRERENELGTSGNAVRDNVKKLASALKKQKLTTHRPNKSGTLSETGETLLKQVRDYLMAKYATVPSIND
jgi:HEAT repeat protein